MKENPDLAYFKWDCNGPITNIYSPYLKDKQGRLYVDRIRGVYNVVKRVSEVSETSFDAFAREVVHVVTMKL